MVASQSGARKRRIRVAALVTAAVTLAATAACTADVASSSPSRAGSGSATTPAATPTPSPSTTPAVITTSAVSTSGLNPATPITVSIDQGTLTSVTMTNAAGVHVTGQLSNDNRTWQNTEDLGYGKTYNIAATGRSSDGQPVTKTYSVQTLTPGNMTDVSLDRTGDYALTPNATYGVGLVPEMLFDEPIVTAADKAAAEKAVTVVTSPQVAGAWAWQDNSRMLWRPESYWPANTTVTINANVYGVQLGSNLYGQQDKSISFTIGRTQITKVTDTAPASVNQVFVYNGAGQVLREMNTSMGKHGGETVDGNYINFYTLNGTYTVLEHDNPAMMSSASYGLPADAPGGYAPEPIYFATKISVDGIYLHELKSTVYAQDHGADVSHGCLNLNPANATWFFQNSLVGDPVEITGAAGAPNLKVWEGGAWTVPWSVWQTGNLAGY